MKKLKTDSDRYLKQCKKLLSNIERKRIALNKKILFGGKYSKDGRTYTSRSYPVERKILDNLILAASKMEKKYIQAKLNYINSPEYANDKYKTDRKKYDRMIIDINRSLQELRKIYSKAKANGTQKKSVYMAGFVKKHGAQKYDSAKPKDFIDSFISLKKTYSKKAGNYNYEDAENLYSSRIWARKCAGKEIISEREYRRKFHTF
jgi:hypothetical protein